MSTYSNGNQILKLLNLHVHEYLGEFKTESEKAMARRNLGLLGLTKYDYETLELKVKDNTNTINSNYSELKQAIDDKSGVVELTEEEYQALEEKDSKTIYSIIPDTNGHDYIDLGLPSGTLWATTNIGTTLSTDYGLYFSWGDTVGYTRDTHTFNWENYKWCNGTLDTITKYQGYLVMSNVSTDGKEILDLEDDAAYINWGKVWHIPTYDLIKELKKDCNWVQTDNYNKTGKSGYIIYKKHESEEYSLADAHIFLPFNEYDGDNSTYRNYYWSNLLENLLELDNYTSYIIVNTDLPLVSCTRCLGCPIRPVIDKSTKIEKYYYLNGIKYTDSPDLSNYILKSTTSGLIKNDGSIDITIYATKATTLNGYGITDASINGNTITLGENTLQVNKLFTGTYNADLCIESGWYDAMVLGRPEGSESDEKYFLYVSGNGGQICYSRRNSGKIYHRLGIGHPWVSISHDDYTLELASKNAILNLGLFDTYTGADLNTTDCTLINNNDLYEIYAGDTLTNKVINCWKKIYIPAHSVIRVRCLYRRSDNPTALKYDSDCYIYLSNQEEAGHNIGVLQSDFIKVKSLGSWELNSYPGLTSTLKSTYWTDDKEYGWHYITTNNQEDGYYYIHIKGDIDTAKSWFCMDNIEVYSPKKLYTWEDTTTITPNDFDTSSVNVTKQNGVCEVYAGWDSVNIPSATFTTKENYYLSSGTKIIRYGFVRAGEDNTADTSTNYAQLSWDGAENYGYQTIHDLKTNTLALAAENIDEYGIPAYNGSNDINTKFTIHVVFSDKRSWFVFGNIVINAACTKDLRDNVLLLGSTTLDEDLLTKLLALIS